MNLFFADTCSPEQVTCENGQFVGDKSWLCDEDGFSHNECNDTSDEDEQICGKSVMILIIHQVIYIHLGTLIRGHLAILGVK